MTEPPVAAATTSALKVRRIAAWRGLRVLAWDRDVLYACRGYQVVCRSFRDALDATSAGKTAAATPWEPVARFRPAWWRTLTSRASLTYRLVRDGFHALVILSDQSLIGAVPGAIVSCLRGDNHFHITHRIRRGTRPLHLTAVPSGEIYWGEYFDNRHRDEVHIYASIDRGRSWHVAHTFPAGAIRHVHNLVYDRWSNCLWIFTGDIGPECQVLRASCDLRSIEPVLSGNQQTRAVAAIPTPDGLYLSTDTPLEHNHVHRLDRTGHIECVADLNRSSIYGCSAAGAIFFSTMVEPSNVSRDREVHLVGSTDGTNWRVLAHWQKDRLPMRYFQYGNAILPDGENTTRLLALTTVAVASGDQVTSLWDLDPA